MRSELIIWASAALLLMAAESVLPGAYLLWLGLAAAGVFATVLLLPDLGLLAQVVLFVVLAFAAVLFYRKRLAGRGRPSDQPQLNRRAHQYIGRQLTLQTPLAGGRGRAQIDDTFWELHGPDLPAGARVQVVAVQGMALVVAAA